MRSGLFAASMDPVSRAWEVGFTLNAQQVLLFDFLESQIC